MPDGSSATRMYLLAECDWCVVAAAETWTGAISMIMRKLKVVTAWSAAVPAAPVGLMAEHGSQFLFGQQAR